jgi:hypothetical protein
VNSEKNIFDSDSYSYTLTSVFTLTITHTHTDTHTHTPCSSCSSFFSSFVFFRGDAFLGVEGADVRFCFFGEGGLAYVSVSLCVCEYVCVYVREIERWSILSESDV